VSLLGQVLKKSVPNTLNINIMTIHTNLPVYKTSYDLLLKTIQLVDTFPKKYKYSIWDKIKDEIVNLTKSIYQANSSFDNRLKHIKIWREQIEVLRLWFQVSKDIYVLSVNQYADICLRLESLSKQMFHWEKSVK
jgi:hypothetical protein